MEQGPVGLPSHVCQLVVTMLQLPPRPAVGLRQQLSPAPHQQVGSVETSLSAEAAFHPPTHPKSVSSPFIAPLVPGQ